MDKFKEKTIEENMVYDGRVIKVRNDKVEIYNGKEVERELVIHPGGVGIAIENKEGKFYMVEQYRYGQETTMLEFPAGKKEIGEEPLETAKREVVEETGYEGTDFIYLGRIAPTPAYDTEVIDLYYTKEGEYKGQHLDEDEDIELYLLSLDEIIEKIVNGEIQDAKTVAMAFLVKEYKGKERYE